MASIGLPALDVYDFLWKICVTSLGDLVKNNGLTFFSN